MDAAADVNRSSIKNKKNYYLKRIYVKWGS